MSPSDALSNDSESIPKSTKVLTSDEKTALRARVSRLMTPQEFTRLLTDFQETVAEVIAKTDELLESKRP